MTRRRAVSLVELLLTMSACTVILTLSAGMIHRVMHVQSKSRAVVDGERSALRLANQFRRDVHQAARAETEDLSGEGVFLRLRLGDDQVIEYRHREASILRMLLEDGATKAREEFVFPPEFNATIGQDASGIVVLTIASRPPDTPAGDGRQQSIAFAVPVSLNVEARLNRDSVTRPEESR